MKQILLDFDICKNKHGGNVNSVDANPKDSAKSKMRAFILEFIKSCGEYGATAEEISITLSLEINRVSGRCSELKKYNMVKLAGTRFNKSGKSATVLVARDL